MRTFVYDIMYFAYSLYHQIKGNCYHVSNSVYNHSLLVKKYPHNRYRLKKT